MVLPIATVLLAFATLIGRVRSVILVIVPCYATVMVWLRIILLVIAVFVLENLRIIFAQCAAITVMKMVNLIQLVMGAIVIITIQGFQIVQPVELFVKAVQLRILIVALVTVQLLLDSPELFAKIATRIGSVIARMEQLSIIIANVNAPIYGQEIIAQCVI
jgi:hypothetical protein